MIERKLPGCEKESFVYDKGDRLVFSRDGNLQARKQWLYHVYDNHGNLLRQNLLDYDISREQLQSRYETLVDNLLPVLGGTTDMDIRRFRWRGTIVPGNGPLCFRQCGIS